MSAVIAQTTDAEIKTEPNPHSTVLDNRVAAVSPKRPNDNSPNVKKKVPRRQYSRGVTLHTFVPSWSYVLYV